MRMNETASCKITNLTFACTLAIVLLHLRLAGVGRHMPFAAFEKAAIIAVPTFFAISGFLLSQRIGGCGWYLPMLHKRFLSLVVPYVAINALYIPSLYVYHNILGLGDWSGGGLSLNWYTVSRIWGLTPKYHPACGPFWYIRCLIMFLVLSPMLTAVIKRSGRAAVTFLIVLFFGVSLVGPLLARQGLSNFAYSFFNLRGLFFFAAGIAYGYWGRVVPQWSTAVSCLFGACLLSLSEMFGIHYSALSLLSLLLYVFAAFLMMPAVNLPSWMTASSFAIYSLHMLLYLTHAALVKRLGISGLYEQDMFLWTTPLALTLGACYGITYLVRRYAPFVGRVLFGGRC